MVDSIIRRSKAFITYNGEHFIVKDVIMFSLCASNYFPLKLFKLSTFSLRNRFGTHVHKFFLKSQFVILTYSDFSGHPVN